MADGSQGPVPESGRAMPGRYSGFHDDRGRTERSAYRRRDNAKDCILLLLLRGGNRRPQRVHVNPQAARSDAACAAPHASRAPVYDPQAAADQTRAAARDRTSSLYARYTRPDACRRPDARKMEGDRRPPFCQPQRHRREHGPVSSRGARLDERLGLRLRHRQRRAHGRREGVRRVALAASDHRRPLQEQRGNVFRVLPWQ